MHPPNRHPCFICWHCGHRLSDRLRVVEEREAALAAEAALSSAALSEEHRRADAFKEEATRLRLAQDQQLEEAMLAQQLALERQRLELTGTLAEQQRLRRTEEMAQRAAKRMSNQGILRGWAAWHEQYEEAARQKRMLAAAAARLAKPRLTACLSTWTQSWLDAQQAGAADHLQKQLAEEQAAKERLRQEVERLQREIKEQLTEAVEAQRVALERQRATLTGSLEAQEKEKRLEELSRKAAKRMSNQGILRGWAAWHEQYEEAARQKRMLAAAAARLAKPRLTACLWTWTQSWLAGHKEQLCESARLAIAQARREAAATRISLEEVISDLEAEMLQYMEKICTQVPPKEPRYLVLHTIAAQGVPDADAAGGADPYVRFILLDHDGPTKEEACTPFKMKESNPVWENERLQLKLALGGQRPPVLRVEVRVCAALACSHTARVAP